MVARYRHPPTRTATRCSCSERSGGAGWSFLPQIRHETLVLCGDDDPLIPIENAQLLARRIPNARLEIVEGAGHLFLWDDVENVAELIDGFVNAWSGGDERPATKAFGAGDLGGSQAVAIA